MNVDILGFETQIGIAIAVLLIFIMI